jgi:hypothetical protein
MASFSGIGSPGGIGIDIRTQTVRLLAHAAITKGRVYAVSRTPGSTTEGDAGAVFFDTTAAIAGSNSDGIDDPIGGGVFVLAMEDVASGAKGMFMISGIMDAELATAGTAVGDILSADSTSALRKPAATQKVIGIALEAGGDGDIKRVLFDGLHGFGVKPA